MSLKSVVEASRRRKLLHVASPIECNMQQSGVLTQQADATKAQHIWLDPREYKGVDSNTTCNSSALQPKKSVQQSAVKASKNVALIWKCNVFGRDMTIIDPDFESIKDMEIKLIKKFKKRFLPDLIIANDDYAFQFLLKL
mgnify:CR=1 FL=1